MTDPLTEPRLLADIGGTNARFAWQSGPGAAIEAQITLSGADHATIDDAIETYLQQCGRRARADAPLPSPTRCLVTVCR